MNYNATPSTSPTAMFSKPLADCNDIERLKSISERLWSLLDDIDTASDVFKPSDEAGYRKFYECAMRKCEQRGNQLESDGYELYLPIEP